LVAKFVDYNFDLNNENVALALESCIGGHADRLQVLRLQRQIFKFVWPLTESSTLFIIWNILNVRISLVIFSYTVAKIITISQISKFKMIG
jgi:hypothetical protein